MGLHQRLFLGIAVLCVTTIIFMGLWSNSAQEARTLWWKLGDLEDNYESLNSKYVKVVEDYDRLASDYSKLTSNYSNLKAEKIILEKNYSSLYSIYESWKSAYDTLKKDYDEMSSVLNGAKAIKKSAEWISEDGRLKVTSELIVVSYQYLGIVSYTIRVNVTNIGNKPIDKVVIFLFPYVDGKFAETYLEYYAHSVESLYIGGTYSYDFTYLTKDITSYKVLAVAG